MLDIYLSAVSASIHKILLPLFASRATLIATANVEPPEIPVIIPSLDANFFDHKIPSAPVTGMFSSKYLLSIDSCKTYGIKSVVHP